MCHPAVATAVVRWGWPDPNDERVEWMRTRVANVPSVGAAFSQLASTGEHDDFHAMPSADDSLSSTAPARMGSTGVADEVIDEGGFGDDVDAAWRLVEARKRERRVSQLVTREAGAMLFLSLSTLLVLLCAPRPARSAMPAAPCPAELAFVRSNTDTRQKQTAQAKQAKKREAETKALRSQVELLRKENAKLKGQLKGMELARAKGAGKAAPAASADAIVEAAAGETLEELEGWVDSLNKVADKLESKRAATGADAEDEDKKKMKGEKKKSKKEKKKKKKKKGKASAAATEEDGDDAVRAQVNSRLKEMFGLAREETN